MRTIELDPIPNQSMSFFADDVNVRYDIIIQDLGSGVIGVTISADNVKLCDNSRAIVNVPILKFQYLEDTAQGNFMFVADDQQYPYWDQFGSTANLVYASAAEIAVLQAAADAIDPVKSLGTTKVAVIRNSVVANLEPIAMGATGVTTVIYDIVYKGGTVVSVDSTPVFFIKNFTTGVISPLVQVGNTNYLWPSFIASTGPNTNPPPPNDGWQIQKTLIPPTVEQFGLPDPFGGNTAYAFKASTSDGTSNVPLWWYKTIGLSPALPLIASLYVKADVATTGQIVLPAESPITTFNITTGWTRVHANGLAASFNALRMTSHYISANNIYVAGAQLEVGTGNPTTYIPTSTGPVTAPNTYSFSGKRITLAAPLTSTQQLLWSGNATVNF